MQRPARVWRCEQRLDTGMMSARLVDPSSARRGLDEMRRRTEAFLLAHPSIRRRLDPEEGKNAVQEGDRKRSRAQFLVVVDQSGRPQKYISERAALPSPEETRPATRASFYGSPTTTALVLCDRDNLSPLKEFRDISSRVLSVAKTGLDLLSRLH